MTLSEILWDVTSAITNGVLLPKGHGDLKDTENIKDMMYDKASEHMMEFRDYLNIVHFAPTIIKADKEDDSE